MSDAPERLRKWANDWPAWAWTEAQNEALKQLLDAYEALVKERDTLAADNAELLAALEKLVAAEALKGVRELVAGWNGENRPEGPYAERHPVKLGATLPKTNCGAVYELDEAMQKARAALARHAAPAKGEV